MLSLLPRFYLTSVSFGGFGKYNPRGVGQWSGRTDDARD